MSEKKNIKEIEKTHIHNHEAAHSHGTIHSHEAAHSHGTEHSHGEGHTHTHTLEHDRAIMNRLARAIGHLQSIRTMVENGRDCSEILVQLAAVKSAINNTGKEVLKEHISTCIIEAVEEGDQDSIKKLNQAIDSFLK